jgi:hypothetical protein
VRDGRFRPPRLASLESVLEQGIQLARGRVFADLWDAQRLPQCPKCGPRRIERLRQTNLTQALQPPVLCDCERAA